MGKGFLFEIADGVARGQHRLAFEGRVHAGEDLEQCGFSCAVEAEDADFGGIKIGKGNVLENFFLTMTFGNADHGVDDFIRFVFQMDLVCRFSCLRSCWNQGKSTHEAGALQGQKKEPRSLLLQGS